jgi:DNA-binding NarL/FixJ family response regulator
MTKAWSPCYKKDELINILIFEDNWIYREALVSALGKENAIEIIGAVMNIQEGLSYAEMLRPDVVLTDVLSKRDKCVVLG